MHQVQHMIYIWLDKGSSEGQSPKTLTFEGFRKGRLHLYCDRCKAHSVCNYADKKCLLLVATAAILEVYQSILIFSNLCTWKTFTLLTQKTEPIDTPGCRVQMKKI